jgi:spermidine synthase
MPMARPESSSRQSASSPVWSWCSSPPPRSAARFRWRFVFFASDHHDPARRTGLLYALNTTGAATGALVSGFILIPTVGLSATTRMGIGASLLAVLGVGIASVFERSRSSQAVAGANPQSARSAATSTPSDKHKRKRAKGTAAGR